MSIRRMIAAWLDPEAALKAKQHDWLIGQVHESYRWLGEFDEIGAYLQWLLQHHKDSWRGINDHPWRRWRWYGGVPEFREQARRLRKSGAPLTDDRSKPEPSHD